MPAPSKKNSNQHNSYQTNAVAFILALLCTFAGAHFLTGGRLAAKIVDLGANLGSKATAMMLGKPMLPDNASAADYFKLAVDWKCKGWVEPARAACQAAIARDPQSNAGKNARIFMTVALPLKPITAEAEKKNIEAYNLMAGGQYGKAAEAFRSLMRQYPEFEWPYGNLAAMYLDENNISEAEALVNQALAINPNYLNGLNYKAQIGVARHDIKEVQDAVSRAEKCLEGATDASYLLPIKDQINACLEKIQLHSGHSS